MDQTGNVPYAPIGRVRRRWVLAVAVVGIILTATGLYSARKPTGVYWSRADVRFLIPRSSYAPNVLRVSSQSVVMTAGTVARMVDPSGGKKLLADQTLTLASEGIRNGWAVTLPNSGSQWVTSYSQPQIQIEAVGPTVEAVATRMKILQSRVRAALNELQRGSRANLRITLLTAPAEPPPVYFQADSRIRALAATLGLGIGLTLTVCGLIRRIGRRRSPAGPSVAAQPRVKQR